jgi:hypothetical protein
MARTARTARNTRCTHATDEFDLCIARCDAFLRDLLVFQRPAPVVSCLCTSAPVVNGRCVNCDGVR